MSEQEGNGIEPQEEFQTRAKRISGQVKRFSQSERVRDYLIGLGALTGLILGLLSQFRGEPVARKTWDTVRLSLNEQAKAVNKLRTRMVYFQAWQEAKTAVETQKKLEELQKSYDELKSKRVKSATAPVNPSSTPVAVAQAPCSPKQVRGSDGKCHRVLDAVAARVNDADATAKAAHLALKEEKSRRIEAEHRKRTLMKQLQQQNTADEAPKLLKALPPKLDDA